MAMRGMEKSLWILIVIIVILVVAVVILTVFTGGIGNFMALFFPWVNATAGPSQCASACQSLCLAHPDVEGTPPGWAQQSAELDCGRWAVDCECEGGMFGGTGSSGSESDCPAGDCRTTQECISQGKTIENARTCSEAGKVCCP